MNKNISKVFIASDHRGVGLKLYLTQMLSTVGYSVVDMGVQNPNESVDFPDIIVPVVDAVADIEMSRGILICGSGAGVSIAANRYRHIRATRCFTPEQAREDRQHNDTNILALGADNIDVEMAFLTATAFLEAEFDAEERRINRIKKIS